MEKMAQDRPVSPSLSVIAGDGVESVQGNELTPSPTGLKGKQRSIKRRHFETSSSSKAPVTLHHRVLAITTTQTNLLAVKTATANAAKSVHFRQNKKQCLLWRQGYKSMGNTNRQKTIHRTRG